ncbi:MAG: ATP-dependent helicase HrpB [Gammaproteobacteria bacterium]|nr:MAG: ATP-dependent helicase HrpB [Gammaproteobacteria bacterium]
MSTRSPALTTWCRVPLEQVAATLDQHGTAVLVAPPGAGKSTGVPLALLSAPWLHGQRIVMLQPRRLAARAVAERMATLLGESPGGTVGYRTRLDSRIGRDTRIEVLTEGILTRRLQHDPALEGVGLLIFDEYHERSLQADLGLALALDARRNLVPELRVLVMSATLDAGRVARLLDDAPVIESALRSHPVDTRYLPRGDDRPLPPRAARAVSEALSDWPGDVLVFLPGAREIRRTATLLAETLQDAPVEILPLYGDLPAAAQARVLAPATEGRRRVILATNIAETSLTLEGVRVVIDAGLARVSRFDPASGMSRLVTVRAARTAVDQRRGRAGRTAPGVCLRLWTEAEHRRLPAQTAPEILEADLASLALELACWGDASGESLHWLDPPPAATLAQARDLLARLGALAADGRVTVAGRRMAALGTHPRLARMLLASRDTDTVATACALAALLGERDPLRGEREVDLRRRLAWLAGPGGPGMPQAPVHRTLRRAMALYARRLGVAAEPAAIHPEDAGQLLAHGWPDRIALARDEGGGRFLLSGGRGARLPEGDALLREPCLVVAALDAGDREARIQLAAPLDRDGLQRAFAGQLDILEQVSWDPREAAVMAVRECRLGALVLERRRLEPPPAQAVLTALLAGLRAMGLDALPWTPACRQWQARVLLLRAQDADAEPPWPDVSDAALLAGLEHWLGPWLTGMRRREHLARLDLAAVLAGLLDWPQRQRLETLAPTQLRVPSGSRIAVDYLDGEIPSLSVRLQEVFGLTETPRIAGGRVPVLLKLLSPARRPVQVTRDLASFWNTTYAEVRRELKGRYPKHYWPEDPHQAEATRHVRPRRSQSD